MKIRKCVFCGEKFGTVDGWAFHKGQRGCKTRNNFYREGMWQTYDVWWTPKHTVSDEAWFEIAHEDPSFDPNGKWGWSEKQQKIV